MTGLILKDFINLKRNVKIFAALTVLYGVMALTSRDSGFFSSIFTMLFAILIMSTYSYDEMAKWDGYALTMPVSKDNIVQGKYIMVLLLTLLGSAFSTFFTVIINIATKQDSIFSGIQTCGVGAAIVILFYSITLPFITKLGIEKARFIFFAIYLVPFFLVYVFQNMLKDSLVIPQNILQLADFFMKNIYIVLPVVVVVALAISYKISVNIYRKKEF